MTTLVDISLTDTLDVSIDATGDLDSVRGDAVFVQNAVIRAVDSVRNRTYPALTATDLEQLRGRLERRIAAQDGVDDAFVSIQSVSDDELTVAVTIDGSAPFTFSVTDLQ